MRAQAANLLSASRVALAIAWVLVGISGRASAPVLGAIAIAAAISDLLDGRLARRMGVASGVGRWLDSLADIIFVLTVLSYEAWVGAIPFYLPTLIALSFSQYAIDSMLLAGAPIKSRLGHLGGIINYALVIGLAIAPASIWSGIIPRVTFFGLAVFYIAAMVERAIGYFSRAG